MPYEEIYIPAAAGILGVFVGAFIAPHVQYKFSKRLLLGDKKLARKIHLYEGISECSLALWHDITIYYSTLKTINSPGSSPDDLKQPADDLIASHKRFFRSFGKLMLYSDQNINLKANSLLKSFTDMTQLLIAVNATNEASTFRHVDNLIATSQHQIKDLMNSLRLDLKIDTVQFGDSLFSR